MDKYLDHRAICKLLNCEKFELEKMLNSDSCQFPISDIDKDGQCLWRTSSVHEAVADFQRLIVDNRPLFKESLYKILRNIYV